MFKPFKAFLLHNFQKNYAKMLITSKKIYHKYYVFACFKKFKKILKCYSQIKV